MNTATTDTNPAVTADSGPLRRDSCHGQLDLIRCPWPQQSRLPQEALARQARQAAQALVRAAPAPASHHRRPPRAHRLARPHRPAVALHTRQGRPPKGPGTQPWSATPARGQWANRIFPADAPCLNRFDLRHAPIWASIGHDQAINRSLPECSAAGARTIMGYAARRESGARLPAPDWARCGRRGFPS